MPCGYGVNWTVSSTPLALKRLTIFAVNDSKEVNPLVPSAKTLPFTESCQVVKDLRLAHTSSRYTLTPACQGPAEPFFR